MTTNVIIKAQAGGHWAVKAQAFNAVGGQPTGEPFKEKVLQPGEETGPTDFYLTSDSAIVLTEIPKAG